MYQAYGAFLMLRNERSLRGGGFLCDESGLGRQAELIVLIALEQYATKISKEVQKDRNPDGRKHLPRSSKRKSTQNATSQCPSELAARASGESPPFQICCPCVEHGPSGQLELKGQATLMIVPEHAIPGWVTVLEKFMDFSHDPPSPGKDDTMRLYVQSEKHGRPLTPVTKKYMQAAELVSRQNVIMLTSPTSYKKHVQTHWENYYQNGCNIPFGRIIRDDFHLDSERRSLTINIMTILANDYKPYVWFVSNTPYEEVPSEFQGPIDILKLVRPEPWSGHQDLMWADDIDGKRTRYLITLRSSQRHRQLF